jgi:DNA-directed RNA polymerase subunit RPC12/RpoP
MASWVLSCTNCSSKFEHSRIDDTKLENYFIPPKPAFPPGGVELQCPKCGKKAMYQKGALMYQD